MCYPEYCDLVMVGVLRCEIWVESNLGIVLAKVLYFEYHNKMCKLRVSLLPVIWSFLLGASLLFSQQMGLSHTIWHTYSSIHQHQPDIPAPCHDCEQLTHAGESLPMTHCLWVSPQIGYLIFPERDTLCPDSYPPQTQARDPPNSFV